MITEYLAFIKYTIPAKKAKTSSSFRRTRPNLLYLNQPFSLKRTIASTRLLTSNLSKMIEI